MVAEIYPKKRGPGGDFRGCENVRFIRCGARGVHSRRPMRILAVNQFYPPDMSATSQLLGELCEDLVAAGHEVEVIASQGTYRGGERLDRRNVQGGVEVRRPW